MKKPTTIQLKFSVTDDDPLKDEIFKAFGGVFIVIGIMIGIYLERSGE